METGGVDGWGLNWGEEKMVLVSLVVSPDCSSRLLRSSHGTLAWLLSTALLLPFDFPGFHLNFLAFVSEHLVNLIGRLMDTTESGHIFTQGVL